MKAEKQAATQYPETQWERKSRLAQYLGTHHTCPTTDGRDLEIWEDLKETR